jgi:phosphoglucosamine mutase
VARAAYEGAGAQVELIAAEPDGLNINDGVGSTHIGYLAEQVVARGADLGIAHDGDADRCLAVDATGALVDGDQILAICATQLHAEGRLADKTVVATVMSNLGFHHAMRAAGIDVVTTAVGDRYVLEALRERGLNLGGEQSGHVVFTDAATTGDGLLTALNLMAALVRTGRSLAELASIVQRLPQVLINVPVVDKEKVAKAESVAKAVSIAERALGGSGRILLRPSGTENLVRVMVEAPTVEQAEDTAHDVVAAVQAVR